MTPNPAPRNWFGRNWKWLVPTGCLTLLFLACALVAGILAIVVGSLKSSDVYKLALLKAQSDVRVEESIGPSVRPGWFISGNISVSGDSGDADFSIPISGEKGSGKIYVRARKFAGLWRFEALQVGVQGRAELIDLLEASSGR